MPFMFSESPGDDSSLQQKIDEASESVQIMIRSLDCFLIGLGILALILLIYAAALRLL